MTVTKSYITNELFDAFLSCKYKSYLLLNNVDGQETEYIKLTSKLDKRFHDKVLQNLSMGQGKDTDSIAPSLQPLNSYTGQELLFNIIVTKDDCHSHIDAIERISGKSKIGLFYYEPIMFCRESNTAKRIRLSLSYRAFVLGKFQGKMPDYGTIISGSKLTRSKVKLSHYFEEVLQIVNSLLDYINHQNKPSLYLNYHCDICRFKDYCRKEAVAKDHLSLLRGISETEIIRNNRKGIFTVTQLSYTFRTRRKSKRAKPSAPSHNYPLQALALRENKIYIHGNPQLPRARVHIYFDVEGLPTRDFN